MARSLSLRKSPAPPRPLPRAVYRWDLDKTYLKSEFNTLRELVKTGFEKAEHKKAAPGVTALIHGLREAATRSGREVRVYFISASPTQMAREIKKKLEMDGIVYDGIVFKDQLQRIIRGKFRHLREHVGYKLTELLKARAGEPPEAREYLFGDDWESDPLIYSLYADVLAGHVSAEQLERILEILHVEAPLIAQARAQAERLCASGEAVARIYINLERRTPPANFRSFGPRLVPAFNYFQTAACLFQEGALERPEVAAVAKSLLSESAYTPARLANSLADVRRRGHLNTSVEAVLHQYLVAEGLFPPPPPRRRGARVREWLQRLSARWQRETNTAAAAPAAIDYVALISASQSEESNAHDR